jgi:hypothetical protein
MVASCLLKRERRVGNTKRGKSAKVTLVADSNSLPIGFSLANVSRHEDKLAVPMLETVRVFRRGRGKPKQRPEEPILDRAYDSNGFRQWLRSKRIRPTIPT